MIGTEKGREAILKYKEENHLTFKDLGTMFSFKPQWIQQVLSGEATGPQASKLIISIIHEFKI